MTINDTDLLQICLQVTGTFEGNSGYDSLAGNFDGMGISAGCLQWNAGQGTLQILLQNIGAGMGWPKVQTFFKSDIHAFANMDPADAIEFAKDHYIVNNGTTVAPAAEACWKALLGQPESIAAQQAMAVKGPLARAKTLVNEYVPSYADRTRSAAFFFDLVNQDGGMQKKINGQWVAVPIVTEVQATSWQAALALATQKDGRCAAEWQPILQNGDGLSRYLLHYAYQRAQWVNPAYVWDTLSRRGTIACRIGRVHGGDVNLAQQLD